jgi:F-type H+-transporting ATPase subunit epsilon/F-type H+-transporting ATPase subunit delta
MMSNVFKLDIVNPEKSFLSKEDVTEVVVPAFEGDMGILKDHISIISFLKPGLLRVIGPAASEEIYYVEDGVIEFKNNCLSVLTSNIFDIKKMDKNKVKDILDEAEKDSQNNDISDQAKYLVDQKIEVLKSLTLN